MNGERFLLLAGWRPLWKPESGEPRPEAWHRCPDVRWMLRQAINESASARWSAGAAVACAGPLFPGLVEAKPWKAVLELGDSFARGRLAPDPLRRVLADPGSPLQEVEVASEAGELFTAARKVARKGWGVWEWSMADVGIAALLRSLHPDRDPPEGAEDLARAVEMVASAAGIAARSEARAEGELMLSERALAPPLPLPGSHAWDEVAERGYAAVIRDCADAIRRTVSPPWS